MYGREGPWADTEKKELGWDRQQHVRQHISPRGISILYVSMPETEALNKTTLTEIYAEGLIHTYTLCCKIGAEILEICSAVYTESEAVQKDNSFFRAWQKSVTNISSERHVALRVIRTLHVVQLLKGCIPILLLFIIFQSMWANMSLWPRADNYERERTKFVDGFQDCLFVSCEEWVNWFGSNYLLTLHLTLCNLRKRSEIYVCPEEMDR